MAAKKYTQFPTGTYDPTKILLQADPITGALEKVNLPSMLSLLDNVGLFIFRLYNTAPTIPLFQEIFNNTAFAFDHGTYVSYNTTEFYFTGPSNIPPTLIFASPAYPASDTWHVALNFNHPKTILLEDYATNEYYNFTCILFVK